MGGEAGEGKISKTATYVWNFFCSTYKLNPPNMTEFYSIKIYSQKKKKKKKKVKPFMGSTESFKAVLLNTQHIY